MKPAHLLVNTYVYLPPAQMLSDLSEHDAVAKTGKTPHSIAEIVAHMEFWQSWFLRRCRGENDPMVSSAALGWPEVRGGYWADLRENFLTGLEEAVEFSDESLAERVEPAIEFPPMADYTVRDAITHIGVHNAHHLGQVVLMRQMLGLWPPPSGSWTW